VPSFSKGRLDKLQPTDRPYWRSDSGGAGSVRGLKIRVNPNGRKFFYFQPARGKYVPLGEYPTVTIKTARNECPKVLTRISNGENPRPEYHRPAPRRAQSPTLNELFQDFEAWYRRDRKAQGYGTGGLDPTRTALNDFGDTKVTELNTTKVSQWREGLKSKVRPSTINRRVMGLRSLINYAIKVNVIEDNPLDGLDPRRLSEKNPDEAASDIRPFSRTEERHLRDAIANRVDYLKPMVIVALGTGMRRGEVFRMQWGHVRFDEKIIRIPKTKSGNPRNVNMNNTVMEALREWRLRRRRAPKPDMLVFPGLDNRTPMVSIKKAWTTLRRDANIRDKRFHDLRHTFASRLLNNGTPMLVVARLLGHSTEKTTEIYGHSDPALGAEAVEALDG
jgi:integrase